MEGCAEEINGGLIKPGRLKEKAAGICIRGICKASRLGHII